MHEGHRARLKKRYRDEGLDNFSEINILELILFFSVPRRDTNPIAHKLLEKYGSVEKVFEAEFEDLITIKGITENSAVLIKLILSVCRYYMSAKSKPDVILPDVGAAARYLAKTYIGHTNEVVKLLTLDAKGKMLGIYTLFEGNINSVNISVRKIIEVAILSKASAVVLSHNHPGGIALPTEEDILTTRTVKNALKTISVSLIDHIIVADDDYISLSQSGVL